MTVWALRFTDSLSDMAAPPGVSDWEGTRGPGTLLSISSRCVSSPSYRKESHLSPKALQKHDTVGGDTVDQSSVSGSFCFPVQLASASLQRGSRRHSALGGEHSTCSCAQSSCLLCSVSLGQRAMLNACPQGTQSTVGTQKRILSF